MRYVLVWEDAYGRTHVDRFEDIEKAIARWRALADAGESASLTTEDSDDA